jgi:hypothetical protein
VKLLAAERIPKDLKSIDRRVLELLLDPKASGAQPGPRGSRACTTSSGPVTVTRSRAGTDASYLRFGSPAGRRYRRFLTLP